MEYIVAPEEGTFNKKPCKTYIVPDPCMELITPLYGIIIPGLD